MLGIMLQKDLKCPIWRIRVQEKFLIKNWSKASFSYQLSDFVVICCDLLWFGDGVCLHLVWNIIKNIKNVYQSLFKNMNNFECFKHFGRTVLKNNMISV